ncbi:substrate-binding periplasmic protein [Novispirillum itersonii]|uniref:ABC-type amino acid transport substrate-binding protein n=1 Tax=Novispirillum itersonii TaxID=189 RepID=A0A7W9ZEU4_NOVIT|nr:transporter substrate-binding domain-containing protein [Novispirillum itersonii]MBB6210206.1 ABC-type amino acid transport substrate-binding protein [Novispirillum itersonii]
MNWIRTVVAGLFLRGAPLTLVLVLVLMARLAAAETVTIAAEDAFPPWSLPDGRGAGNEIVQEAFRRQGVTVELAVVPYARCRRAVITGDVAACLSMGANEVTRRDVMLPTPSLAQIRAVLVTDGARSQAALPGCDPAQWPQRPRIGIVNGYEYPAEWDRIAASGRAEVVTVQSDSAGLRMLGAGRLDGMVLLFDQLRTPDGLMHRAGQSFPLSQLCPLGGITTYLGFSASRPDSAALLRRFEDGYRALQADGTLDAILSRWRDREDGPPGH